MGSNVKLVEDGFGAEILFVLWLAAVKQSKGLHVHSIPGSIAPVCFGLYVGAEIRPVHVEANSVFDFSNQSSAIH